jgi:hypothetical protein
MPQNTVVLILSALIAILAIAGVWTGNAAVLTMAASVITGLFAFLQVRKRLAIKRP